MNRIRPITIWIPIQILPSKTLSATLYFVITFSQAFNIGIVHFIKVTDNLKKKQDISDTSTDASYTQFSKYLQLKSVISQD